MTPKEYLSQCLHIERDIRSLQSEYDDIKATVLTSSKYQTELVSTSRKNTVEDKAVDNIDKLFSYWEELDKKIDEKIDLKRKISAEIEKVKNPTYQQVLRMRYLSLKKWKEIATALNYDISWVYKLHDSALLEFAAVNPELFPKRVD